MQDDSQSLPEAPVVSQPQVIAGDQVGGDKVGGDKLTVGDVSGTAIAIGTGATVVGEGGSLTVQN